MLIRSPDETSYLSFLYPLGREFGKGITVALLWLTRHLDYVFNEITFSIAQEATPAGSVLAPLDSLNSPSIIWRDAEGSTTDLPQQISECSRANGLVYLIMTYWHEQKEKFAC